MKKFELVQLSEHQHCFRTTDGEEVSTSEIFDCQSRAVHEMELAQGPAEEPEVDIDEEEEVVEEFRSVPKAKSKKRR